MFNHDFDPNFAENEEIVKQALVQGTYLCGRSFGGLSKKRPSTKLGHSPTGRCEVTHPRVAGLHNAELGSARASIKSQH